MGFVQGFMPDEVDGYMHSGDAGKALHNEETLEMIPPCIQV